MRGDTSKVQVMARREEWDRGISIHARIASGGGGYAMAQPAVFEKHDSAMMSEPFMRLEIQEAQQLMDELWQCGLRPSEGTGSAGSLRATEKHLSDMRDIVFDTLKIKGRRDD